jgi:hypothetical protein
MDLITALTISLNLPDSNFVTIVLITYSAVRRQLLADTIIVDYKVSGNAEVSAIIAAVMASPSALTRNLISKYPNAKVTQQATTTNVSPTASPSIAPATVKSSAQSLHRPLLLTASIIGVAMYL